MEKLPKKVSCREPLLSKKHVMVIAKEALRQCMTCHGAVFEDREFLPLFENLVDMRIARIGERAKTPPAQPDTPALEAFRQASAALYTKET